MKVLATGMEKEAEHIHTLKYTKQLRGLSAFVRLRDIHPYPHYLPGSSAGLWRCSPDTHTILDILLYVHVEQTPYHVAIEYEPPRSFHKIAMKTATNAGIIMTINIALTSCKSMIWKYVNIERCSQTCWHCSPGSPPPRHPSTL